MLSILKAIHYMPKWLNIFMGIIKTLSYLTEKMDWLMHIFVHLSSFSCQTSIIESDAKQIEWNTKMKNYPSKSIDYLL